MTCVSVPGACARSCGCSSWTASRLKTVHEDVDEPIGDDRVAGLVCDVRDVIHNFNADGFDSLYPRYRGGRPPKFTLPQRREIKKIPKTRPVEHGLPS